MHPMGDAMQRFRPWLQAASAAPQSAANAPGRLNCPVRERRDRPSGHRHDHERA